LSLWSQIRDRFFLLFAIGFGRDAAARFALGLAYPSDETEPLFYVAVTFGLIIAAIVEKKPPNQAPRVNRKFRRGSADMGLSRRRRIPSRIGARLRMP
jgi:hypothetical protein